MKLQQAIVLRQIKAGGPGSGRHADGGIAPRYAKLHDTLTRHGWTKQEPSESEKGMRKQLGGGKETYTHPEHGKITVEQRLGNEVQHYGKDAQPGKPTAWMHLNDAHDYVKNLGR